MKKYDSINGLRMLACIGIILMHVKSNMNFQFGNYLDIIINSFTQFVFLFMVISAFSMCCGYYEKIKNNNMKLEEFYKKRIMKIWPIFTILVLLDVIVEHNKNSILEGYADITMMFGFIPKKLEVIGVGWFIGLIFIFYMIFPFFVFLFSNKKRAWIVTLNSLVMNLVGITYFDLHRENMFYSLLFFCVGGMIYLYRNEIIKIVKNKKNIIVFIYIICIIGYYIIPNNNIIIEMLKVVLINFILLSIAIGIDDSKILDNKITKFISNISLEIYLCHMVIYRIVEKTLINNWKENSFVKYFIVCCIVICGTILVAQLLKKVCNKLIVKEKRNV